MAHLWDQQENETPKAYAAFCIYRDLGETRSLRKTAQNLNKTLTHIAEWSERHDWVGRARAYDAYLELNARKQREAEHAAELAAYRARARKAAQDAATVATAALLKAGQRLQGLEPDQIEPGSLPAFLRAAAAVMEGSLNAEAEAIGVRRLEALLNERDEDQTESDGVGG